MSTIGENTELKFDLSNKPNAVLKIEPQSTELKFDEKYPLLKFN